jgi:hypothetical protein
MPNAVKTKKSASGEIVYVLKRKKGIFILQICMRLMEICASQREFEVESRCRFFRCYLLYRELGFLKLVYI